LFLWHFPAAFAGSVPPDHPALRCPDFPRGAGCLPDLPAAAWPTTVNCRPQRPRRRRSGAPRPSPTPGRARPRPPRWVMWVAHTATGMTHPMPALARAPMATRAAALAPWRPARSRSRGACGSASGPRRCGAALGQSAAATAARDGVAAARAREGHARLADRALSAAVRAGLVERGVESLLERHTTPAEPPRRRRGTSPSPLREQRRRPVQHRRRHATLRQTPTTRPTMSTSRA
jgi:hypothetical protein